MFIEFLGLEENPPSSVSIVLVGTYDMSLLSQEIHQLFSQTETNVQQFGNNIQYMIVSLNEGNISLHIGSYIASYVISYIRTYTCILWCIMYVYLQLAIHIEE